MLPKASRCESNLISKRVPGPQNEYPGKCFSCGYFPVSGRILVANDCKSPPSGFKNFVRSPPIESIGVAVKDRSLSFLS